MTPAGSHCIACDSLMRPGAGYCVRCGQAASGAGNSFAGQTPRSGDLIALAARREALTVRGCACCGGPLRAGARFCGACGTPVTNPPNGPVPDVANRLPDHVPPHSPHRNEIGVSPQPADTPSRARSRAAAAGPRRPPACAAAGRRAG